MFNKFLYFCINFTPNMDKLDAKGHINIKEKQVKEVKQEKQIRFIGGMRKRKGLSFYAYDTRTHTLKPLKPVETTTQLVSQKNMILSMFGVSQETGRTATVTSDKYNFEEGIIYIQALNEKNALKKIRKALNII